MATMSGTTKKTVRSKRNPGDFEQLRVASNTHGISLDEVVRRRKNVEAARKSRRDREARTEQLAKRLEQLKAELQKAEAEVLDMEKSVAYYKGYVEAMERGMFNPGVWDGAYNGASMSRQ
ncbi:hypothetical protein CYLTODRAFT_417775 [Cylindrobasidium torrendii FP15055 ss-10]|uniref:BZIP domain-containing protein n=1 Tax=Cylindrobasidium torrendii FP15055 ss-10 TaxID=1314674 RepID=A0A0D7BPS8_9AGAR|nr:hypothetical protein CYLTODRAFT_417775 [Cylindrobasidium torrendii FP15055 ss-10]